MADFDSSILGMNNTTYTRRDVMTIYEYLKEQARELSDGRWTDFSSGDIGSILLGLMAYLADCNNFQIDKTASELFLDTAVERTSIMSILKLIGYKPRHYESAYTTITFEAVTETQDSTSLPAYTTFVNKENTVTYTLLEPMNISRGFGSQVAYEGTRVTNTFTYNQISSDGRIYLPDYKVGFNTVQLLIPNISNSLIPRVEDVRFVAGIFAFSVHVDEYARVYIQLPSYWSDSITSGSYCIVTYLISQGEAGRIGENILTVSSRTSLINSYNITNTVSEGGYFPETVDELKVNAPVHARTMDTIVTKKDFEELANTLSEIADVKCGDYNDAWTGYVQPDDAYKAKVLVVPSNPSETSIFVADTQNVEDEVITKNSSTSYSLAHYPVSKIYQLEIAVGDNKYYDSNGDIVDDSATVVGSINYSTGAITVTTSNLLDNGTCNYVYEIGTFSPSVSLLALKEYVDARRLSSLMITYEDPIRLTPNIRLNIYMSADDLRVSSVATTVESYMKSIYGRESLGIGDSLYGSTIGKDLLNAFPYIDYLEVVDPDINIECGADEYIDMFACKFKIYVNDELVIDEWEV